MPEILPEKKNRQLPDERETHLSNSLKVTKEELWTPHV
jgi:hypothetical protein